MLVGDPVVMERKPVTPAWPRMKAVIKVVAMATLRYDIKEKQVGLSFSLDVTRDWTPRRCCARRAHFTPES